VSVAPHLCSFVVEICSPTHEALLSLVLTRAVGLQGHPISLIVGVNGMGRRETFDMLTTDTVAQLKIAICNRLHFVNASLIHRGVKMSDDAVALGGSGLADHPEVVLVVQRGGSTSTISEPTTPRPASAPSEGKRNSDRLD
jgi:hypothetical protein